MDDNKKICKKCGISKNRDMFYKTIIRGYVHERLDCKQCFTNRTTLYQKNNIEKKRAYTRAYELRNKEKIRERRKAWDKNHPERAKQNRKNGWAKWYSKNKIGHLEKQKKWRKENLEKVRARSKKYRMNNLEKYKERWRINNYKKYWKDPEKSRRIRREWISKKENQEKTKKYRQSDRYRKLKQGYDKLGYIKHIIKRRQYNNIKQKNNVRNLSNKYIMWSLRNHYGMPQKYIDKNPELIEVLTLQLKGKRKISELTNKK